MFRSWRSEKKKFKAVFELQFQATQVPQLKKPSLILSLMPEDVGKPTFKLERTAVKDGTCSWENPVYLTVKLVKELKAAKLHEKIYHFIVSSGSSKSGYLGEASIDLADFAEETQPLTLSLPLKFANSGAVLHVTIRKMQGGTDQRFNEDNGEPTFPPDTGMENQLNISHKDGYNKSFAEDRNMEDEETEGSFKEFMGSNAHTMKKLLHQRSSTDLSIGSASDGSLFDTTKSPEENHPRESQETSEPSIEQLKTEISNLTRQSELSELELQSLRKQIIKETKRAQDLSRQVADLKEERDELKADNKQLKSSQKYVSGAEILKQLQADNEDSRVQLEEIRQELCHEKEMKTNLELQLQKTQDSNSELLLAVQDLDEMLEQKNMEIFRLSSTLDFIKTAGELQEIQCKCNMKKEEEHRETPEVQELVQEQHDIGELDHLKQKIRDLYDEIETYREERQKLENCIEQVTQDYEDLKQENCDISSSLEQRQQEKLKIQGEYSELKSQVQRLEEILKQQTQELSESMVSINELSTQVKELEQELEKQAQEFENDLDAVTHAKIEQEQRAICAEEALRKTTWKYASTAERLHEEFKRLSLEMATKYDENEKLTMKALTDADELCTQNRLLEDRLQKVNKELVLIKGQNQIQVEELSSQLELKIKLIEQLSVEVKDRSKQLIHAAEDAKYDNGKATFSGGKHLIAADEGIQQIEYAESNAVSSSEPEERSTSENMLHSESSTRKSKPIEKETSVAVPERDFSSFHSKDEPNLSELLNEMTLLRERNESMERELKEMQERYTEISLKFAVVEGERQELVMTVRNLRNGKKN